jgi:hypothetical protein
MVIFGAEPLVHAMLTAPAALRGVVEFAWSDSYRPKLNAVALIAQFAGTRADMPSTAVVPPASGGPNASAAATAAAPTCAIEDLPLRRCSGMPTPFTRTRVAAHSPRAFEPREAAQATADMATWYRAGRVFPRDGLRS